VGYYKHLILGGLGFIWFWCVLKTFLKILPVIVFFKLAQVCKCNRGLWIAAVWSISAELSVRWAIRFYIQGDLNPIYAQTGERQELALGVSTQNNVETLLNSCKQATYYTLWNTAVGMAMEKNLENSKYTPLRNNVLGHPFVQEWYSMKKTEARHL